jgi:hypothetical protein
MSTIFFKSANARALSNRGVGGGDGCAAEAQAAPQ